MNRKIYLFIVMVLGLCAPVAHAFEFNFYGPGSPYYQTTGFVGGGSPWGDQSGFFGFSWPWDFAHNYPTPTPSNRPPIFSVSPAQYATEGQSLQFAVVATDPEGQAVTYSAISLPQGASFNPQTRLFTWMPATAGTYTATFRASDGRAFNDQLVTIVVARRYGGGTYGGSYPWGTPYNPWGYGNVQISPLNQTPTIAPIAPQYVRVGERVAFNVQGYDAERDYLRYSAVDVPQGATFDENTRAFFWVPGPTQIGRYNVKFRVSQGGAQYAETSVSITVLDRNGYFPQSSCGAGPYYYSFNPPVNAREGDFYGYQIIAGSGNSNRVTYRVVDGPAGMTVDANGYVSWVPAFNQSGTYNVRLAIFNGNCEEMQNFAITVQNVVR